MPSMLFLTLALAAGSVAQPESITFPTSDGGEVGAHRYGTSPRVVVLVHGGRFAKESWAEQAPVLVEAGFQVLAIDLRGKGRSRGGSQTDSEQQIHLDVLAAVRFAREHGATSVSLIGASLGGWAAGQAAVEARPGEIDRIVLLAATPIEEPERMQGRKLFILAREDFSGSGRLRLESIRDQYDRAPGPKELVLLEGDAHAQFLFDTDQGAELMQELVRFLTAP